ncbi:hypothetical protein D0N36_18285 [Hymenobacter lapidiphilus]|nr:hypothetical protein D0N36_18285 [Hymenobacter sp. CCM 8763]
MRGYFERQELALYWALAFQPDFFDEEIAAFRTFWRVIAGERTPTGHTPCFAPTAVCGPPVGSGARR